MLSVQIEHMLKEGEKVPDFSLPNQDGKVVKLSDFKGKTIVLYFYPKDDTPGCTTEAKNFRDHIDEYKGQNVEIIGISADSVKSHKKFLEKYNLNFTLLSDEDKKIADLFGALEGGSVKRRTWVIGPDGIVKKVYEKVSAANHNDELCAYFGIKLPNKNA